MIRLFSYFVDMGRHSTKRDINEVPEIDQDANVNVTQLVIPDPGQALRPNHKGTKLTRTKKKQFLQYLAEYKLNVNKAAHKVGVTRTAIMHLLRHDQRFKEAYDVVKQALLDQIVETSFVVAFTPTRDGYNDRRLLAEAYIEDFQRKPQFQQNILITGDDQKTTITQILQEHMPTQNITVDKSRKNKEIEQENKKAKTVT